ncbi:MAG: hydrogen peroxide-inducible genes activator [Gammaproteobacteria bacterium]|nr:MAG: hydrogen peroxide-inducible genes activator [Gammaproteobacteria bacterium]
MANITLKQLKYLCAVAQLRHFGNAAKACHISQSALSTAILELENQLGVTLLERQHKHVMLTPIGEQVVERAQALLADADDLIMLASTNREPFTAEMHMGVIPTIAPYVLPQLLAALRKNHPDFKLFIREDLSGNLVQALQQGELDVLLLALPYPADNTATRHLFHDPFQLAYPPQHPVSQMASLKLRDLKGQDLLLLEDGHCLRDHALDACRLKNSDVNVPYQATSLNTIVQMVANGIGITLLPQMAIDSGLLAGTGIQIRPFTEKKVWRSIGLMWRSKCPREREFQLLGDFILQHAPAHEA